MFKKLKKLTEKRYFIPMLGCLPFIILIASVLLYIIYSLSAYMPVDSIEPDKGLIGFFRLYWRGILAIIGVAVAFVVFIKLCIPVILFPLAKLRAYLSLSIFCKRRGYKFKILRLPFASLKGVESTGDIDITANGITYCIHFIDIVFRFSRVITVIDGNKYIISKAYTNGSTILGAVMGNVFADKDSNNFDPDKKKFTMEYDNDKVKHIPDFSSDTERKHIIMLASVPADARLMGRKSNESLYGGAELASSTFYYVSSFKRRLMR